MHSKNDKSFNITYFLGAGASYNALPIAEEMKERMSLFVSEIKKAAGTGGKLRELLNGKREAISLVFEEYQSIIKEINKHYSVDTYAKKLFLRGDFQELLKLKWFLAAYLEWEQYTDHLLRRNPSNKKVTINANSLMEPIDYRYDSFLATYLLQDSGLLKLPYNVHIITWNYDSQLELAFLDYIQKGRLEVWDAKRQLGIYLPQQDKVKDALCLGESKIIHINGNSNIWYSQSKEKWLSSYTENSDSLRTSILAFFSQNDKTLLPNFNSLPDISKGDYPGIWFAWDRNEGQKRILDRCNQILKDTDVLIIIGYSFPIFNQEIDLQVFNEAVVREAYVQVPTSENFHSIQHRLSSLIKTGTGIIDKEPNINRMNYVDQFYVPRSTIKPRTEGVRLI